MRAQYYVLTLFLGVVLTVHLLMNGRVGTAINNAPVANALFWCIGAVTALIIGFTGWQSGALAPLAQVNPLMLTAGAMGASLVFAIAWIAPQVPPGTFFVFLLTGQVLSAMIIGHYGWLGSQVNAITPMHLVGAALMLVGAFLTTR
jgi:bacterial/archaeal transporter family-2 protein